MAKLHIQGASANHGDNRNKPTKSPPKLQIQGSSANYMSKTVSTKTTPSPANRPYPPTTRNAPKPTNYAKKGK
jgi:hypothetical protein